MNWLAGQLKELEGLKLVKVEYMSKECIRFYFEGEVGFQVECYGGYSAIGFKIFDKNDWVKGK